MINYSDIAQRFGTRGLIDTEEELDKVQKIAQKFAELGLEIIEAMPEGREQSLAITKLEEAQMWCHAGIGRSK